jgi:UDPglucose 6-dehydrogenase
MIIGLIGMGFVGKAMYDSFIQKKIKVFGYDKYKIFDSFEKLLDTDIIFICLPTIFNNINCNYELDCFYENLDKLNNYNGLIVIKSTLLPGTTNMLQSKYPSLKLVHNPEFLSAKTALDDFNNMKHIVIGNNNNINIDILIEFYNKYYPDAEISICTSMESESMKLYSNSFYAVKIQFFNELYLHCQSLGTNYNNILELMLKNKWINPMHTQVPGTDGKLSYGGYCFPKDTNALCNHMKSKNTPHMVLNATIEERNKLRDTI